MVVEVFVNEAFIASGWRSGGWLLQAGVPEDRELELKGRLLDGRRNHRRSGRKQTQQSMDQVRTNLGPLQILSYFDFNWAL